MPFLKSCCGHWLREMFRNWTVSNILTPVMLSRPRECFVILAVIAFFNHLVVVLLCKICNQGLLTEKHNKQIWNFTICNFYWIRHSECTWIKKFRIANLNCELYNNEKHATLGPVVCFGASLYSKSVLTVWAPVRAPKKHFLSVWSQRPTLHCLHVSSLLYNIFLSEEQTHSALPVCSTSLKPLLFQVLEEGWQCMFADGWWDIRYKIPKMA